MASAKPLHRWSILVVRAKAVWLGDVEATSEAEAIAKGAEEFGEPKERLMAVRRGGVTRLQQFDKIRVSGASLPSRNGHESILNVTPISGAGGLRRDRGRAHLGTSEASLPLSGRNEK